MKEGKKWGKELKVLMKMGGKNKTADENGEKGENR